MDALALGHSLKATNQISQAGTPAVSTSLSTGPDNVVMTRAVRSQTSDLKEPLSCQAAGWNTEMSWSSLETSLSRGRYHGGRRPSSDDSFHSPASALDHHSTISARQTEYHKALPSSANDEVRCDCTFADDGNAS